MTVKAVSVLGVLFLLKDITAFNYLKCGGKLRSRAFFDDDPTLINYFSQSLIRPKILPKPLSSLPLYESSSKGPCFKRTAIVKPAIIPRPIYSYMQPDCTKLIGTIGTNDTELAAAAARAADLLTRLSTTNFVNLGPAIDVSKAYQQALAGVKSTIPADPVSLALAYKMYRDSFTKKVCEDGLTYGFRKLPLEKAKPSQYAPVVSEANLYSLNGEIVELRPISEEIDPKSLSAEALDELVDLECDAETDDVNFFQNPSLADLGYAPAKLPNPTFININHPPPSKLCEFDTSTSKSQVPEPSKDAAPSELLAPQTKAHTESLVDSVFPTSAAEGPPSCEETPVAPVLPVEANPEAQQEPPEPPTVVLPPPLTIKGFKLGDVLNKDFENSETRKEIPVTENHESETRKEIPGTENHESETRKEIPVTENHESETRKEIPGTENHESETRTEIPVTENHEYKEEVVTHIPVPPPPCGLQDLLEGIRTYARAFSSGSRSFHRRE